MNAFYKNENILSLDLGTSSAGWAIVNPYFKKIYHIGINIFPEGVNREKGVEKSRTQERREARGSRKQIFRKKYLQIKLQRFLIANDLFPTIVNLIDTTEKRSFLLSEILDYYKSSLNFIPEFSEKWNKEYLFSKYKFSINASTVNFQVGVFRIIQDYGFRDTYKESIVWEVIQKLNSYFSLDSYKLRNDAVENMPLTKLELGRIFYHLSQLRGFSSNRTDADLLDKKEKETITRNDEAEDSDESNTDEKEKKLSKDEKLQAFDTLVYDKYKCKTYGQFFYKIKNGEVIERVKIRNEKNTSRKGFINEFDTIWNIQKKLADESSFFTPENRKRVEKEILFFQRSLKSQKGLIGKCTLESHKVKISDNKFEVHGKTRSPVSALPYEDFTMYSEINNMFLINEHGERIEFTVEQKAKLIWLYHTKSEFDVAAIAKAINLSAGQFIKGKLDKHLQPSDNAFDVLKDSLGNTWQLLNADKQNNLWNALYFAKTVKEEDEASCIEKIFEKRKIKSSENQVTEIAKVFPCKGDVKIYGSNTHKIIIDLFGKNVFDEKGQDENKINPEQVWQILFQFRTTAWNGKDENLKRHDWLKKYANKKWKITDESKLNSLFKKIKEIETGYGMLSRKAINNILPYLKSGMIYSHAVFYANLEDVFKEHFVTQIQDYNSLSEKEKQLKISKKWNEWKNKKMLDGKTIEEQIFTILKNDYPAYQRKQSVIFECWKYLKENQTSEGLEQKMEDEIKWNYNKTKITESEKHEITEKLKDIKYWHNQNKTYPVEEIRTTTKTDFIKNFLLSNFPFLSKHDVDKLYHPADIEKYSKSTTTTETGLKLLESPHLPGLKNPVVLQTLHEVKHLVNAIIKASETDKTYKVNKVRIEVSRELNDKNKRLAYRNWQSNNEKRNIKSAEKLIECGLPQPTSDDILKYNLWQEMISVGILTCPYCPRVMGGLECTNITKIFGANPDYNIDHIIPDEISCDSTQENLILCCKNCNQQIKKRQMPSQLSNFNELKDRFNGYRKRAYFFKKLIEDSTKKIRGMGEDIEKQNKEKQRREELKFEYQYYDTKYKNLICREEDLEKKRFKERQLSDTGFITKYALAYLKTVFPVVEAVKGKATAFFRRQWLGEQNNKDREQHLHHAEDAIIIGCMDKRIYDKYARFAYEDEQHHIWNNQKYFPKPWENFTEQLKAKTSEILVYYKQKDRKPVVRWNYKNKKGKLQPRIAVRGQLHDAQFISLIKENKNKSRIVAQRVELSKISLDGISIIADTNVRGVIMETINKLSNKQLYNLEKLKISESIAKRKNNFEIYIKAEKNNNYKEIIDSFSKKEKTDLLNTIHSISYIHNITNQKINKVRLHWENKSALKQLYGLNKYAVPNNNYAGIFYKEAETIKEDIIPFYEAVELSNNNELDEVLSGNEFNILENNMYVLGLNKKIDDSITSKEVTNYLFRVQKKQKGDYTFRHHLEATLKNEDKKIRVSSVDFFLSKKPQKIKIDRLGNILPLKKNNYPNNDIDNKSIVSEPETVYQKSNFEIFNSFQEANEADAKLKANILPQQHLANVTQRIKQTYADELKKPMDKTLKFRKDD